MGASTLPRDSSGSGGQQWREEAAGGERGSFGGGRQRWWREATVVERGRNGRGKHCCGRSGDTGGCQQRWNSAGFQTVTRAAVAAAETPPSWDTAQLREAWAQRRQERPLEHTPQRRLRTALAYYSLNVAYLPVMGRGMGKPVISPTSRTRSANRATGGPDISPTA